MLGGSSVQSGRNTAGRNFSHCDIVQIDADIICFDGSSLEDDDHLLSNVCTEVDGITWAPVRLMRKVSSKGRFVRVAAICGDIDGQIPH